MIIDTHAHLYYPELLDNIENVLEKAAESGVGKIIVPAVDLNSAEIILNMSAKYKEIYAAVGFHPGDLKKYELSDIKTLGELLNEEKVVALGEIGLDYYWDKSQILKQKKFFSEQLELSKDFDLPVIIHTRESTDDVIEILKLSNPDSLKGQFHCFSGNLRNLNEILDMNNFYISYCGNITYRNFKTLNLIENTPLNRLLFETDSPFLTPVPFRGKPNQPAYISYTVRKISEVLNTELIHLKKIVYDNTISLFKF